MMFVCCSWQVRKLVIDGMQRAGFALVYPETRTLKMNLLRGWQSFAQCLCFCIHWLLGEDSSGASSWENAWPDIGQNRMRAIDSHSLLIFRMQPVLTHTGKPLSRWTFDRVLMIPICCQSSVFCRGFSKTSIVFVSTLPWFVVEARSLSERR